MYNKIAKIIGPIILALLLVCGLVIGLASAGSPPSTSTQPTHHRSPIKSTSLSSTDLQQPTVCPNFNDIVGATYDPNTKELILIGQITGTLPMMDYNYLRENLAVAMRAVHAAPEYPGVTIGTTPSPDPSYQLVEYFGNIGDAHYGYTFFEADRLLKS